MAGLVDGAVCPLLCGPPAHNCLFAVRLQLRTVEALYGGQKEEAVARGYARLANGFEIESADAGAFACVARVEI